MSENHKNLKILFIVPKFPARTYEGKTMGPDYLAGYLIRELGIKEDNIEILDLDVLPREELKKTLHSRDFDLVGISFLSFQIDEAMNIAEEVDSILYEKGAREKERYVPIIVGNHGTAKCDEVVPLYPYVDAWIIGEGFEAVHEIAKGIRDRNFNRALAELENAPGSKIINGWKLINKSNENQVDKYFPPYRKHHYPEYDFKIFGKKKTAQILTALGCPGSCAFCFEGMLSPVVRARSLESIRRELEQLVKEGYQAIYIDDSTFTYNRKRALEIISLLKEFHEKYGLVWAFNTRIECLDDELLKIISKSGCVYLFCGVESLSPSVVEGLNKVNKGVGERIFKCYHEGSEGIYTTPVCTGVDYVKKAKEVYTSMRKYNLVSSVFLIFGGLSRRSDKIETENFSMAKESIRIAVWELQPDYISINILRFIPDAAIAHGKRFRAIRPVEDDIHAGYFSSKWREKRNIKLLQRTHPIYTAFEAAGDRYPIPSNMKPEYCYKILKELVRQVNSYYKKTGKEITIVVDKEFDKYLKKENGFYVLSKFGDMEPVKTSLNDYEEMKARTNEFINRIKRKNNVDSLSRNKDKLLHNK